METCPLVSFVVPCYKLGHLLQECVDSILTQTYSHLEVLIMDDCSPDDTETVAHSYDDPRVRYIRNEHNLGHLRNYNKGIALSNGHYVWLISADDKLRRPYILERYVRLMEEHPNVGYICCPGIGLHNSRETGLVRKCGYFGSRDRIFNGRDFIKISLRKGYGLLSPSVMVRRDCYERVSTFPLDMPHQGDWYLWIRWAIECDVAYFCEPMVNYRDHELNMMKDLVRRVPETVFRDEVNVLWRTKQISEQKGFHAIASQCAELVAEKYARAAAARLYDNVGSFPTSPEECERALRIHARNDLEYTRLRAVFFDFLGNKHWRHGKYRHARESYSVAVTENWCMWMVWIKIFILITGLGYEVLLLKSLPRRLGLVLKRSRSATHRLIAYLSFPQQKA
jgi:glycosyltransferase involved in cell wall biosynthesis